VPLVSPQDAFVHTQQAFGPPPGLAYPPGLQNNVVNDGKHNFSCFREGGLRTVYRAPYP
jgi:hypothetical protein